MFVFMGNRIGSPPSNTGGGSEGQNENNDESDEEDDDDGTVQAGLAAAAGAAMAAGAGVAAGSGLLPVDGEIPDGDCEEDDDADSDSGEEVNELEEEPVEPPSEDIPSSEDDHEYSEPEDYTECEDSEAEPEEEDNSEEDFDDEEDEESRFVYGDIVYDRDQSHQGDPSEEDVDLMVVVNIPDARAYEWEYSGDETVADRNPHYPPFDDVIVVVDRIVLDDQVPSWDEREEDVPVEDLEDSNIPYTAHPSLRLELDEPSHLRSL